jgi:hypothetical protein
MKTSQFLTVLAALVIGILIGQSLPHMIHAQQPPARESLSEEDVHKKLDEILEAQTKIKQKIEEVTTQSQFLKIATGK